MRRLSSDKLKDLKNLTNVRKLVLLSKLEIAQAKMAKKENEIKDLKTPIPNGSTITEIKSANLYQNWRQQELPRLTGAQAALRAELSIIQQNLGRAFAEDATADHMQKNLESEKKTKQNRQAELASSSHFLPNNIRD